MIKSPTYTIVREYEGRVPLYHLDVYRIGDDPDSIDLDDFLYGEGVTIIEWGELLDESLLGDYLLIRYLIMEMDVSCFLNLSVLEVRRFRSNGKWLSKN